MTTAVKGHRPDVALHVAFTYEGLQQTRAAAPIHLAQFPYEFKSGMTEPSRARRLGDVAANDPQRWLLGRPRQACRTCSMLLYAVTPGPAGRLGTGVEGPRAGTPRLRPLASLTTNDIGDIEPFGFNDGISQPVLDWERKKPAQIHDTTAYTNLSALGEVLLGYPNEYGRYTDRPLLDPR